MQRLKVILVVAFALMSMDASGTTILMKTSAEIIGTEVRLGDIADLSQLDGTLRKTAAQLVLAKLRRGADHAEMLEIAPLLARARAQMPALAPWLVATEGQTISLHVTPVLQSIRPMAQSCWQAVRPINAEDALRANDLQQRQCTDASPPPTLYYDAREHVVRASQDVAAGTFLGPMAPRLFASVARGQTLNVSVTVGHVAIARRVAALQNAPAGHSVFVRTDSGDVLSAKLPKDPL